MLSNQRRKITEKLLVMATGQSDIRDPWGSGLSRKETGDKKENVEYLLYKSNV